MVEQSSTFWAESLNSLVISFFKKNIPQFILKNETIHGPYWGVSFFDHNGIEVRIRGENDGFDIVVKIDTEEYPLWKFDRSVNNASDATEKDILYQLSVLKSFLDDTESLT